MSGTDDLNGLWEGHFRYFASEDIGEWPFKARIVVKDGALSGMTIETASDGNGEVKAEIKGTVEGALVAFSKRYLQEGEAYSRVISYEGTLSPDYSVIEGTWTHSDGSGPFVMTRQS